MKLFSKVFKLVRYLYAYIIIPRGMYCYKTKTGKMEQNAEGIHFPRYRICPYWSKNKDKPNQCNGYCGYLKQGDWDIEKEMTLTNAKTGEVTKGDEMPFSVGLLWDQVKECGIKNSF